MTKQRGKNIASCPDHHDENSPIETGDRLPMSIQVVAWVFLITGTSSLVKIVLQSLVMRDGLFLDFHIVGIFIGRGLLRRREGWLRFARGYNAFLLAIAAAVTILSVGFCLCLLVGLVDGTGISLSGPPALVLPVLLGVSAYLVWQQRVLSRPDVREVFRRAADAPRARGFQFNLGTLLMLVVLAAVVLPQVTDVNVLYVRHGGSTAYRGGSAERRWTIHYGYRSHRILSRPEELDYAVFLSEKESRRCEVKAWHSSRGDTGPILETSDGTRIVLDGHCQLMEYIDGRYRESPERVTKAQFDAFLASNPPAYTINALLEFAKRHPE